MNTVFPRKCHYGLRVLVTIIVAGFQSHVAAAAEIEAPTLVDDRLEITLVAAEPAIVTPIGIAIDKRGQLFVVESHTHQRPANYEGPPSDRVLRFAVRDDGSLAPPEVFAEGFTSAMNLAFSPQGELYLVHRNGVLVLHDDDGDGRCDRQTKILSVETDEAYPHNGLSGIAFGHDGWLYIGTGENMGAKYTLHGSDEAQWKGCGGDGANVFRCKFDGSELELYARGAWNVFALEFDRRGNLFAVDNDPDGRPPCRLLHIVRGGDYGYRYRLGRHGQHPFQAWDGELPGTLPMVAGTGEAPSALWRLDRAALPREYHDALMVTSWGDHLLEIYRPEPHGASFRAKTEIFARGGEMFRPVGIATAPDGTIYVTDWVDRSYPVHDKGRIWRIRAKQGVEVAAPLAPPDTWRPNIIQQEIETTVAGFGDPRVLLDDEEIKRRANRHYERLFHLLLAGAAIDEAFAVSATIHELSRLTFREKLFESATSESADVRLGALLALRRSAEDWAGIRGQMMAGPIMDEESTLLRRALRDKNDDVRFVALSWIGEACLTELQAEMDAAMSEVPPSARVFRAYLAATELLADPEAAKDGRPISPAKYEAARAALLEKIAFDEQRSTALRTLALAMFTIGQRDRLAPQIIALATNSEGPLQREAIRALAETQNERAIELLLSGALDPLCAEQLRADAAWALARNGNAERLRPLLDDGSAIVKLEAQRALLPIENRETAERPADLEGWLAMLAAEEDTAGNAESGRRLFFSRQTNCGACHRVEGRGGSVGPDLTTVARSADRLKLIESIVDPSREIAPLYSQHIVQTAAGKTYAGLWVDKRDAGLILNVPDQGNVTIPHREIEEHVISDRSLMPDNLAQTMTVQDFRDLLAFLQNLR